MNKRQLIEAVSRDLDITKTAAARNVDAVLARIIQGIRDEDKVAISGFGTFRRCKRKGRRITNPSTREMMMLPETTSVGFTPSQVLKTAIAPAAPAPPSDGIREVKPSNRPELASV